MVSTYLLSAAVIILTFSLARGLFKSLRATYEESVEMMEGNESIRTGKWSESEVLVAAYIAENYRMTNDNLLEDVAYMLNRSKSSLVRKINRLRAVHTGKAPYATELDKSSAVSMKMRSDEGARGLFFDSLRALKADTYGLDELLSNSKKLKGLAVI